MGGARANGLAPEVPPALVPTDQGVAFVGRRFEELYAGRVRGPVCHWGPGRYPCVLDPLLEESRRQLRNVPRAVAKRVTRLGPLELDGQAMLIEEIDRAGIRPALKQDCPR